MLKQLLFSLLLLCALASCGPAASPPAAHIVPVTDEYFGTRVVDPYRWLENLDDPKTQAWMKSQNVYARSILDNLNGRAGLLAMIEKYYNGPPAVVSDVTRLPGDRYLLLKTPADGDVPLLFIRQGLSGTDKLLVDTRRFAGPHGEPPQMNYYEPSFDGRYVAYGVSAGGSENATLHIVDVQTGRDLPETIDRERFDGISWRHDNQSFFYNRLQKLAPGQSPLETYDKSTAWLHILNTSPDTDIAVLGFGLSPRVPMTPMDDASVDVEADSDYVVGQVGHGVKNEQTLYSAPLSAFTGPSVTAAAVPWVKICDVDADVTDYTFRGDDLYLLTHDDAPRYKIIRTSVSHPDVAHADTVVPQQHDVLRYITCSADALYAQELDGAINHILRVPWGGAPQRLALPFEGGADIASHSHKLPGVVLGLTSWTKGSRYAIYDPATNQVSPTDLQPPGPYDNLDDIASQEVLAPSYDGTLVPLSIIYKKGIIFDTSNPTIVWAYGGYGITRDSSFDPSVIAWVERGGVYAVAHVRGGGEEGEPWHLGAQKLTKPNVWRDLIACCQYLIRKRYTSSPRLAITGGSNGGITVGRAITEHPELFAAAQVRAGVLNSLRMEFEPNGPPNVPEYGDVKTLEGFEDLYAMDAYQHVKDGVQYPAVLLTTGINDPRVSPAEPAKMAARLQAATGSGKPVLLTVDFKGGHTMAVMSKSQRDNFFADEYSFFLWQFGDPAFLPKSVATFYPDVVYTTAGGENTKLDACIPTGSGPFPAAILVHGGGWHAGDKHTEFTEMFQPLTAAHYAWFSIDYRLTTKNLWPACFEDTQSAIRWVKAHATQFNVDPHRIVLIGYSAGGELATLAAAKAGDDTRVAAVVAFAPPTDLEADTARRNGLNPNVARLFGTSVVDDHVHALLRQMSAIDFLHPGLPPFLLIQGNADKSVIYSQTQAFAAKLRQLGVPCDFLTIDKAPHDVLQWEALEPDYKAKVIEWLRKMVGD